MGIDHQWLKLTSRQGVSPTGSIVAVVLAVLAVVGGTTVTAWNASGLMEDLNSPHGESGSSWMVHDVEPDGACR